MKNIRKWVREYIQILLPFLKARHNVKLVINTSKHYVFRLTYLLVLKSLCFNQIWLFQWKSKSLKHRSNVNFLWLTFSSLQVKFWKIEWKMIKKRMYYLTLSWNQGNCRNSRDKIFLKSNIKAVAFLK